MTDIINWLAKKLHPELEGMSGQQRISGTADVLTVVYTLPLFILGLVWLISQTSLESIRQNWQLYIFMAGILFLFNRLRFFFITEIRTGGYANSDGSMDGIAQWVAVLLVGPTALWIKVIWNSITFINAILRERNKLSYWNRSRMFLADVASDLLATLLALVAYRWVGGSIPIKDLSFTSITPALVAILVQYLGSILVYSGYIAYVLWALKNVLHASGWPAVNFFFLALSLPVLANPFGILAAGLYREEGMMEFVFILIGLLLTAILARRLSEAAENSRQQSNQLEKLEGLGRAILDAPPDGLKLGELLGNYVPTMFASTGVWIWTEAKGVLLHDPKTLSFTQQGAWEWLKENGESHIFMPEDKLPWDPTYIHQGPIIFQPIKDMETGKMIGEIFIELQTLAISWNIITVRKQLPAVQSLAAQIASSIRQVHVYAETLNIQKTLQELSLARTIQASFLPATLPQLPGWQFAAMLEPARQIAGDYYDFIDLPDGKLGILIADVADKGLGSALYMALSNTLIRTFADDYYEEPALLMKIANQHILRNARANLFVTIFFAVLDPSSGVLRYANAGHNPPYLLGQDSGIRMLNNTGMPLGIDEDNTWGQEEMLINPGDTLLLYTDGVTDAQNNLGDFIDRKIIVNVLQQNIGKTVEDIQKDILDKIHRFVGNAPRFDDITLVIIGRENNIK